MEGLNSKVKRLQVVWIFKKDFIAFYSKAKWK